jgi:hypothetical protein
MGCTHFSKSNDNVRLLVTFLLNFSHTNPLKSRDKKVQDPRRHRQNPAVCALITPTAQTRKMPTSHHHTKCSCRRQRPCQTVLDVSCPTTRLRVGPPRLSWNRFFVPDLRPVHHQLVSASSSRENDNHEYRSAREVCIPLIPVAYVK